MKKQFLSFIFICLHFALMAQNWNPLQLDDRYNYQHDSENYISNTIWIDSVKVINSDSVFYLNRIVEDCFNCGQEEHEIKLANQSQFLQKEMIKKADGIFYFVGEISFVIDSKASLNETWIFDTLQNINATVTTIVEEEVFGIMDSVKSISLSNQNTFKLAKNFGIIDFQNDSGLYQLKGIEGRAVGEKIPDFYDFYNFEVGDVFQYELENWGLASTLHSFYKHEILSKETLSNGYEYQIRKVKRDSHVIMFEPNVVNFSETEFTWTIQDTTVDYTNQYNRSLIPDTYNEAFPCFSFPMYQYVDVFRDIGDDLITKRVGPTTETEFYFGSAVPYRFLGTTDTLETSFCSSTYSYTYKEGLGEVYKAQEILDNRVGVKLIGYVKGGDTTGTIIPDEVLLLSNSALELETDLAISPNPSFGFYKISYQASKPLNFDLLDINGRFLWRKENPTSINSLEINIENYPAGIYLLKVSDGKGLKTMKLVKY